MASNKNRRATSMMNPPSEIKKMKKTWFFKETFQEYTNFAIHPNIVSEHLKCYKVFKFKVVKQGTKQVTFNFKSIGHIENERINWKKPTDEDGIEMKYNETEEELRVSSKFRIGIEYVMSEYFVKLELASA